MKKDTLIKSLLFISALNLSSSNLVHAMDALRTDQTSDPVDYQLQHAIQAVEGLCFSKMQEAEHTDDNNQKIDHFMEVLNVLNNVVHSYEANCDDSSFTTDNKVFSIQAFYRISQTLVGKWMKTVNVNSREAQKHFLPTLVSICHIDQLIYQHLDILPHEQLISICPPNLAYYNFLEASAKRVISQLN